MLGKLFTEAVSVLTTGGTPTTGRPSISLESVQEDIHTRNLLFPDADALYQHHRDQVFPLTSSTVPFVTSSSNAYDLSTDIELDLKDVRVVVMQDAATWASNACLLYDSHPRQGIVSHEASRSDGVKGTTSTIRRTSLGSKPMTIAESPKGAFDRRPSTQARGLSYIETEAQKLAREHKEEVSTFASCMFGSAEILAHKGPGTKVHIIPADHRSSPSIHDAQNSLGKSHQKGSRLAQSYTTDGILHTIVPTGFTKHQERKKVLITRLFPVPLSNGETDNANNEYPFPEVEADGSQKESKLKQKRTPMFAIGLIITLPSTNAMSATRSAFRSSSFTDHDSLPSSYNSSRPTGWTVLGEGFGVESLDSSLVSDVDDRIDIITKHWDVVVRTLSQLQAVTSEIILDLLKKVDVTSPEPRTASGHSRTASVSISGKRVLDGVSTKPIKKNAKLVFLRPDALVSDAKLEEQTQLARFRVVIGVKTQQVVTRQGRWGIWRDEARWVSRGYGQKEEGFFFYNLLTAFLGTHTDWLQALGPLHYRRRHYQQQRASSEEELPLISRTVIVAQDKMAARRLIFLLAAFLSPNQQQQLPYTQSYRPSTAATFGSYSQAQPSYLPHKEAALRRKANRRRNAHSRSMSFPAKSKPEPERREPDLKTANLPIPGSDGGTRKSSAATTTTVTPVTTIPHFSQRRHTRGTGPVPRPGSSGSLAADDLIRSLKRGDSTGHQSTTSTESAYSKWGSMTSWSGKVPFWNRRRESTSTLQMPFEEEPIRSKLAEMVAETQISSNSEVKISSEAEQPNTESTLPSSLHESHIKTKINGEQGVIDIEVPLPDFLSNFGSVLSSPSSSGYLSGIGQGLEGFEHLPRFLDRDAPSNVGGWLPRYHPDFNLQAIPCQEGLEDAIKSSMQLEPTPAGVYVQGEEQWVDICTSLIADTTKFTIKRIRYRRLIKPLARNTSADATADTASIYGNPYAISTTPAFEHTVNDEFIEDMVISLDDTLTDAVEMIIARNVPETVVGQEMMREAASSTTKGLETTRTGGDPASNNLPKLLVPEIGLEVSRSECKKWILGALEDIAKDVVDSLDNTASGIGGLERGNVGASSQHVEESSVLREGVRRWLNAVDDAA